MSNGSESQFKWRRALNAKRAHEHFNLPPRRPVIIDSREEVLTEIEIKRFKARTFLKKFKSHGAFLATGFKNCVYQKYPLTEKQCDAIISICSKLENKKL